MNCTEAQARVHQYIDAELDKDARRAIDQHLWACDACTAFYAEQQALIEVLNAHAPEFRASAPLRARIESRLSQEQAVRAPRLPAPGWWGMAAAVSLAVAITWGLGEQQLAADRQDSFKDDAVAVHRRSLQERHLVDFASAQPAQLEAWLRQRLPYPVKVKDLSAQGYTLVGGRLDYLYEQALAAIVYRRGEHLINVLIWPWSPSDQYPAVPMSEDRLKVLFKSARGMNFCVISDLEPADFDKFIWLLMSV